jgi:CRISPR-associated protein Cas5d
MLWDIDFVNDMKAVFYRAVMQDGIINVADCIRPGGFS